MYKIRFAKQALNDLADLKKNEPSAYNKVKVLLEALQHDPYNSEVGKPERLRGNRKGEWSRRITLKHRLIYTINDNILEVSIAAAKSHYGEK